MVPVGCKSSWSVSDEYCLFFCVRVRLGNVYLKSVMFNKHFQPIEEVEETPLHSGHLREN